MYKRRELEIFTFMVTTILPTEEDTCRVPANKAAICTHTEHKAKQLFTSNTMYKSGEMEE